MTTTASRPTAEEGGSRGPRRTGTTLSAAPSEAALALVHIAVVLGFSRVYAHGAFVWPLLGFVVGAHLACVACRRWRAPVAAVALAALAGAALAATWLVFPSSTRFGLPTAETWDLAGEALRTSRARFQAVTAPAPVLPGFQLTAGLALWGSVWFADWAAFRLRATLEAVAPATVLFVFCALLGSGQHRVWSTVAFTGAVLAFVASHRALRAQTDQAWLVTSTSSGPRALSRSGLGLAAVAVLGGAVLGPHVPDTGTDPPISWRATSGRSGSRTTVSPIVDLRKRLVNQGETPLFLVTAQRRAYWRLTALDRFDGRLWSSNSTYSAAGGDLPGSSSPDAVGERSNTQRIQIQDLSAIWAPAAYRALSVERASEGLSWDPRSGTLIVDAPEASGDDVTSDGLDYVVVSEAPVLDAEVLRAASGPDPDDVVRGHLGLPDDFPALAVAQAREATAGTVGRYDQAIALQDWFRTEFDYSLDVPAGHGDSAIVDFLQSRTGYCEQFAGTYAAMARSLGMPSRVAVGFTPGDRVPDRPDTYQVRGRHAHAWPEVYFPDVGWVPFEPTPGRGIPGAQAYTGLAEQQEAPAIAIAETTTTTLPGGPATTVARGPAAPPETVPRRTVATTEPETRPPSGGLEVAGAAAAVAGLVVAWLAVLLAAPALRRRRRAGDGRPAAAVLGAWGRALDPVRWLTGLGPRPAETYEEFARRAAPALGDLTGALCELAVLATWAAWSPGGATATSVRRAAALADELAAGALGRESAARRLRRRLSWREAFGRTRLARPAA